MIEALSRDITMLTDPVRADVVHAHTWYTHLAGVLAQKAYGIPLAVTVHSLEPLRPWKREQLGGGYDVSSWIERTAIESARAVIAVSNGTREDVLRLFDVPPERVHVIHNGIDAEYYRPDRETSFLEQRGIDPSVPYVLFVGRVTRQKGIVHLVRAIHHLAPGIGVVLCAGQPDTPEIAREMAAGVRAAQAERPNVVWIGEMVSREEVRQLYSHAAVFCCPSVYEPFGIINLEAAACETPVVASAVGGIPEVVVDGETGLLVPVELSLEDPMRPIDCGPLRAEPGRRHQRADGRCPHPGRHGPRRSSSGGPALQLGRDRTPDGGPLPHDDRLAARLDARHERQGVALAVLEEGHPDLGAAVLGVDHMRRPGEVRPAIRQRLLGGVNVVDAEVEDRAGLPVRGILAMEVDPHAARIEEREVAERGQVWQPERLAVEVLRPGDIADGERDLADRAEGDGG